MLSLDRFGIGPGSEIQDSFPGGVMGSRVTLVKLWLQTGGRPLGTHTSEGIKDQRPCSRRLLVLPYNYSTSGQWY